MSDKTPPRVVAAKTAQFTPRFEYGHMAEASVVSGPEDGTKLGSGFVRLRDAEIPWTIKYDEVIFVVEGALTVRTETGTLEAGPGECIWLPAGTALTYVAKAALVFYAIEPADWAEADQ